jgi:hypothetical protein
MKTINNNKNASIFVYSSFTNPQCLIRVASSILAAPIRLREKNIFVDLDLLLRSGEKLTK